MSFWDILRPAPAGKSKGAPKPPTAAELEAALAEAEAAAQAAEEAAAAVADERASKLLTADDAVMDEVERRLQLATRAADKAAMATETLRLKLLQAQEAERVAGLDAIFAEGQAALDDGLVNYRRYGELAAELAKILESMADTCDAIETANAKLAKAGDARRVADLDLTARPEVSDIRQTRLALWHQVELASATAPHDFIWPVRHETRVRFPAPSSPPLNWRQEPHPPGPFHSPRRGDAGE